MSCKMCVLSLENFNKFWFKKQKILFQKIITEEWNSNFCQLIKISDKEFNNHCNLAFHFYKKWINKWLCFLAGIFALKKCKHTESVLKFKVCQSLFFFLAKHTLENQFIDFISWKRRSGAIFAFKTSNFWSLYEKFLISKQTLFMLDP